MSRTRAAESRLPRFSATTDPRLTASPNPSARGTVKLRYRVSMTSGPGVNAPTFRKRASPS